jgi:hypothetical protein
MIEKHLLVGTAMKHSRTIAIIAVVASYFLTTARSTRAETFGDAAAALGQPIVDGLTWLSNLNNGGDVNGQVGYIFNLPGPRFGCSSWTVTVEKISGQLPAGLTLQDNGTISGIPTEPGNWIATIRLSNIMCGRLHYTTQGLSDAVARRVGFHDLDLDLCYSNLSPLPNWTGGNCREATIAFHITGSGAVHQ